MVACRAALSVWTMLNAPQSRAHKIRTKQFMNEENMDSINSQLDYRNHSEETCKVFDFLIFADHFAALSQAIESKLIYVHKN